MLDHQNRSLIGDTAAGADPVVQPRSTAEDAMVEELARFLTGIRIEHIKEGSIAAARACLMDCLGSAAAGTRCSVFQKSLHWVEHAFGAGLAAVWFSGRTVSPLGAAYLNSLAASALDIDDGHRAASGHPGAAVIPAVLALADETHSENDLLLAIICGYEAGIRIARERAAAPSVSGVATGRWSAIAAAVAAGRLIGLDTRGMAAAISIAEPLASNLAAADFSGFSGGDLKEGIAWSVVVGLCAAFQARTGLRGYLLALENPAVYRPRDNWTSPTLETPLIETVYFKPYACCRWTHAAIDAALMLRQEGLESQSIRRVRIQTFKRAASLPNVDRPADVTAAQFSMPFVVAAAFIHGGTALMPLEETLLSDANVRSLASRTEVIVDESLERLFPVSVPARVEVETIDGILDRQVIVPLGDPANPMSREQLVEKAASLMSGILGEQRSHFLARGVAVGDVTIGEVLDTISTDPLLERHADDH